MIGPVLLIKAEGGAERRKEKVGVKEQKEEELEKEKAGTPISHQDSSILS